MKVYKIKIFVIKFLEDVNTFLKTCLFSERFVIIVRRKSFFLTKKSSKDIWHRMSQFRSGPKSQKLPKQFPALGSLIVTIRERE